MISRVFGLPEKERRELAADASHVAYAPAEALLPFVPAEVAQQLRRAIAQAACIGRHAVVLEWPVEGFGMVAFLRSPTPSALDVAVGYLKARGQHAPPLSTIDRGVIGAGVLQ